LQGENMTCPDPECHQGKEDLKKCVNKMKDELPKFLSKSTAKWGVGILVVVVLAFSGAWGKTQFDVSKSKTDVEVIKKTMEIEFTHVKEKLDEQITTGDIYRTIKRVMRENGND